MFYYSLKEEPSSNETTLIETNGCASLVHKRFPLTYLTHSTQRTERRLQLAPRNRSIPLLNSWLCQTLPQETTNKTFFQASPSKNPKKKINHHFSCRNISEPHQGTNQRRPRRHLYKHLSTFRIFPSPLFTHKRTRSQPPN